MGRGGVCRTAVPVFPEKIFRVTMLTRVVGALGGEDGGHQQLVRITELKRRVCVRIALFEASENFVVMHLVILHSFRLRFYSNTDSGGVEAGIDFWLFSCIMMQYRRLDIVV